MLRIWSWQTERYVMNVFSHGLFVGAAFVYQLYDQAKFEVRRIFFSRELKRKSFRSAKCF